MQIVHSSLDYFNFMAIDILARMGNVTPCEQQIRRIEAFLKTKYSA